MITSLTTITKYGQTLKDIINAHKKLPKALKMDQQKHVVGSNECSLKERNPVHFTALITKNGKPQCILLNKINTVDLRVVILKMRVCMKHRRWTQMC